MTFKQKNSLDHHELSHYKVIKPVMDVSHEKIKYRKVHLIIKVENVQQSFKVRQYTVSVVPLFTVYHLDSIS